MTENSETSPRRRVIYVPLLPKIEALKLSFLGTILSILFFCGFELSMNGWSAFVWGPLAVFCAVFLLFTLNLYVFRNPRAHALLISITAGPSSPPLMVLLAGFILISFGEPLEVAIAVMVSFLALIFLLGWVEATHLDFQKMEAEFRKNKRLRNLPDGFLAYDNYWEFGWGKGAKIPGFGWRNCFDRVVLAAMILAMPIGAATAFTSSGNIFSIPPQWGMATTAILVALLLRSVATSFFAQLAFLRHLERSSK